MGGVEHVQLQTLVAGDAGDDLGPSPLPGRSRPGEPVLDGPGSEGLALDAGGVLDAQGCDYAEAVGGIGRRDDAVDHGRGKGGVRLDPASEVRDVSCGEGLDGGG